MSTEWQSGCSRHKRSQSSLGRHSALLCALNSFEFPEHLQRLDADFAQLACGYSPQLAVFL